MTDTGAVDIMVCRVLDVSSSGYYAWRRRPPAATQERHATLADAAHRYYFESCRIYGCRKVHPYVA